MVMKTYLFAILFNSVSTSSIGMIPFRDLEQTTTSTSPISSYVISSMGFRMVSILSMSLSFALFSRYSSILGEESIPITFSTLLAIGIVTDPSPHPTSRTVSLSSKISLSNNAT